MAYLCSMNKALFAFLIFFTISTHSPAVGVTKKDLAYTNSTLELYNACGLTGEMEYKIFEKAMAGYEKYNHAKSVIAICDFTKPSSRKRFYVIDVEHKKLMFTSLVAHGKNSGDLMATRFSNTPESLMSSLGFYNVGSQFQEPKHGLSLVLNGLESGKNDNARMRGIIIHGADYVSEKFVKQYGYAGKSFGCPALPNDVVQQVVPVLKDGGLLYICAE